MKNFSFIVTFLVGLANAIPTPQAAHTPSDSSVIVGRSDASTTPVKVTSCPVEGPPLESGGAAVSEQQILAAAPLSKSCSPAMFNETECSTAATAATFLSAAFQNYGHKSIGQMAALIGLMTVESVDFQANINHNPAPGRPGQGTKAMLMFNFVYDYALAQPELNAEVLRLSGGKQLQLTFGTIDTVPTDTQIAIRSLVLPDKYSFGAASWFLATKCDASFASQLTTGGFAAYSNYITNCVDAGEVTTDRKDRWCLAFNALKTITMDTPAECKP